MRKLKLQVEDLAVESFDVQKDASQRGTVPAHDYSNPYDCPTLPEYCLSDNWTECNSCQGTCDSCQGTCANTCPATCGVLCGPTYYMATCPPECYD